MIALWMLYATLVTTILAAAAALLDRAAGAVWRQRRWLWVLALMLSAGIPAWAAAASRIGLNRPAPAVTDSSTNPGNVIRSPSVVPSQELADLIGRANPRSLGMLDAALTVIWAASALLAIAGYSAATWSLARHRRAWRSTQVDGQPVLLAPATGPAVIGALRPTIVLPEWSLGLTAEQRALMLDHERQHIAARDPLLLHGAAVVTLLMPWNVGAWWLYRRLRLAVELDCDARVLAAGRDARAYGNLLLDVCARRLPSGALLAPAMFDRTSSLTRRILAMHPVRRRFGRTRVALGIAAAVAVTVLACDVPSPEIVAPDGTNQAKKRLYGELSAKIEDAVEPSATTKAIVSRYFPDVAVGKAGKSILFIVKSAAGDVVLTEAQPWTEAARSPLRAEAQTSAASSVALQELAAVESDRERVPWPAEPTQLRMATLGGPSKSQRAILFKVAAAPGWVPASVGALRPDDIATIDVSKHAPGTIAPKAMSIVTIILKAGAVIPKTAQP